jgi:hypothetical protein
MDQATLDFMFRLQHRHKDGSWGDMVEDRPHHAPSDHDPERGWGLRRIFRCTSCEESVTLLPGDETGGPEPR